MTHPSIAQLQRSICESPSLFPMDVSPDGALLHFVKLSEEDYRRASFLDHRMLNEMQSAGRTPPAGNVPWSLLESSARELPIRCHYIFHVSHCGSTLLSRILGNHPECFSVREPNILRGFVHNPQEAFRRSMLALWSRTYRTNQRALIKATSFVSQVGNTLMADCEDARALLLFVPPRTFLQSVLDGSPSDIESQAASRALRVSTLHPQLLNKHPPRSIGEVAAMGWLSEYLSLRWMAGTYPDRCWMVNFDYFLQAPEDQLQQILTFFGWPGHASDLLADGSMHRYAKKPEVRYDQGFRKQLLEQSMAKHRSEIDSGLRWLQAVEPELEHGLLGGETSSNSC